MCVLVKPLLLVTVALAVNADVNLTADVDVDKRKCIKCIVYVYAYTNEK